MQKNTEQLENELATASNVQNFLDDNKENFKNFTLAEYLNKLLAEKNLSKTEVIKNSQLDQTYVYRVFSGVTKKPARQNVIALALALKLSPKETNYLLYYAGVEKLYVRSEWDSIIFFALENNLSVAETNSLLKDSNELPLLGDI